ncbi:MAG: hypothetical protein ACTS4Z_02480, partial [Candidatus Hodgkinia cicadicola]
MSRLNLNYYPIWNINKLVNYLQDFISIVKLRGYRALWFKIKEDLSKPISLTSLATSLPEFQAHAIIKSINNEVKEFFVVTAHEFANLFLLLIYTILNTFDRFRKPFALIKAKTGWTPPYNLLKRTAVKVKRDFIQNQNPSVTILHNAACIVSFWMQYLRTSGRIESIYFSIFKLLSGALTSKLYTTFSSVYQIMLNNFKSQI